MDVTGITPEIARGWDWEKGKRTVLPSLAPPENCLWQEEPYVSPDGEHCAAVVRLDDERFGLRVDDERWERSFEKAWYPRYAPDGRLTCLVMDDDAWTVAVDGEPWEEGFDFAWGTGFGKGGQIYAAIQQDMRYGFVRDGEAWEALFENANEFSLRGDGKKSAAVVQIAPLKQADLAGFRAGVFSLAVDGQRAWGNSYMNLWTPVFDERGGERVACQARLNAFDYTIVVNDEPWPAVFNCVWAPVFDPVGGALAAPVRQGGRWGMAVDGALFWPARYFQCWNQQWSQDGKHLWAIGAPEFGKFTVLRDDKPWPCAYPSVSELVLSPQGDRAAALADHANEDFLILVDGQAWQGPWDMAWKPVFSPDGRHVAALVRSGGKQYSYLVDNLPLGESFSLAWPPIFSPDSRKVLLRGIQNNALVRLVMQLDDIF
jgi:hypothetical protein